MLSILYIIYIMMQDVYLFKSYSHFQITQSKKHQQPRVNLSLMFFEKWQECFQVGPFSDMVDTSKVVMHPCTAEMIDKHHLFIVGQSNRTYEGIEGTPKGTMIDLRDMSIQHCVSLNDPLKEICLVGMGICSKNILYSAENYKIYYGPRNGTGLTLFEGPGLHEGMSVPSSSMISIDEDHVHYVSKDRTLITVDMDSMQMVDNLLGIKDAHDVFVLGKQMFVLRSDKTDIIKIKRNGKVKMWKVVHSIEHELTISSDVRVIASKWRVYIYRSNSLYVYKNHYGSNKKSKLISHMELFDGVQNIEITCLKTTVFRNCEIVALYTKGRGLSIYAHCYNKLFKVYDNKSEFSHHRVFGGLFLDSLNSILILGETSLLKVAKLNWKDN